MNKKTKAKLIFLSIMSIFNSNLKAEKLNLQSKDLNVTNVSGIASKPIDSKTSVNSKSKNLPKIRPLSYNANREKKQDKQIEAEQNHNLVILKNAGAVLFSLAFLYATLNIIPWGWNNAMKFLDNHNLFREENYNETTQIINELKSSNYSKFGTEFKNKNAEENFDNKITYINLGRDAYQDGTYNLTLNDSKTSCIFLESKYVKESSVKIKIKNSYENQNVIIVSPVHVEVTAELSKPLNLLRVSAPSVCLGTTDELDDVRKTWWQDTTKVKEVYLDTPGNRVHYALDTKEPIYRENFLEWINNANNKKDTTTIEKLTFGPIHIKNGT